MGQRTERPRRSSPSTIPESWFFETNGPSGLPLLGTWGRKRQPGLGSHSSMTTISGAPRSSAGNLRRSKKAAGAGFTPGWSRFDRRSVLLGGEPPPSSDELVRSLSQRNLMPAGCSNVVVRAELFREAGGFDIELRHLADWDLWLRLIRLCPPALVSDPLVAYRVHDGQATLDPRGMIPEGRILAARHGADLNSIRRWLAWSHLRKGERGLAVRAYARAALSGDLSSLGRAAVAALHPAPMTCRTRPLAEHTEWHRSAESWLRFVAD